MSQPSSPCVFGMSETSLSKSWHLKSSFDMLHITSDPIHMIGEPEIGLQPISSEALETAIFRSGVLPYHFLETGGKTHLILLGGFWMLIKTR